MIPSSASHFDKSVLWRSTPFFLFNVFLYVTLSANTEMSEPPDFSISAMRWQAFAVGQWCWWFRSDIAAILRRNFSSVWAHIGEDCSSRMTNSYSRRFSSTPVAIYLRSLGVFKRLDRVGGSDGVLKGGSERGWKRTPRRRLGMLSRSRYIGYGHAWNSMSDMQLGSLCVCVGGGGFVFLEGGFAKLGGSDEPPETPLLVAGLTLVHWRLKHDHMHTKIHYSATNIGCSILGCASWTGNHAYIGPTRYCSPAAKA